MTWDLVSPRSYDEWLAMGLEMLRRSDVVVRFPGPSPGADREEEEADRLGLPIVRLGDVKEEWPEVLDYGFDLLGSATVAAHGDT